MKGDVIEYKEGYKYQLVKDYTITLPDVWYFGVYEDNVFKLTGDQLTIKKGYAWDGPSGPTYDSPSSMRGSLVHDARYQLIAMGILAPETRVGADDQLCEICIEDGMWEIRAVIWHEAVRKFGKRHSQTERPVLTAPKKRKET